MMTMLNLKNNISENNTRGINTGGIYQKISDNAYKPITHTFLKSIKKIMKMNNTDKMMSKYGYAVRCTDGCNLHVS